MKNRRNIVELKYPPENPNDIWLKDGKFYRSTSEGWIVIDSKTEYTSKESMIADNPKGGTIGIDKETGEASIYNDVAEQWSPLSGGGVTSITWLELKDKRDAGKLIPGSLYRITDYNCTTTQENTRSAGHQFDIVLLALSEDKLAEEGWAMQHANDTYFANSNLSAWKVWYCLDNDKSRFAWADDSVDESTPASIVFQDGSSLALASRDASKDTTEDEVDYYCWIVEGKELLPYYTEAEIPDVGDMVFQSDHGMIQPINKRVEVYNPPIEGTGLPNGRGVIYRLIDEFNNDIKYDFKNIQFKRKLTDGQYDATNGTETWCYTLNIWYNNMCQDASIVGNTLPNDEGYVTGVYDNKFGYATAYDFYIEGVNTFAFALGNNVVLSFDDDGYYGLKSNTIGNSFNSNTIGNSFNSNTIGNSFNSNTIGTYFYSNIIGNFFESNTIGNAFNGNTIGNSFNTNTIGNYVSDNTIRDNFSGNTIGNNFNNKTISDNTVYKNYGNNGVELATKDDIGNIETALNNI